MSRDGGLESVRWQGFVAFWLLGGIALLVIGVATFAAVSHAHRLGGVIVLAGIICLAIGFLVLRAARRPETARRSPTSSAPRRRG